MVPDIRHFTPEEAPEKVADVLSALMAPNANGEISTAEVAVTFPLMLKAVVKTIALLAILFVMLYVGMNNGHTIDFQFPVAGTTAKSPRSSSLPAVGSQSASLRLWIASRASPRP